MGTPSSIAIMNEDQTVTAIYCHWDGYLSHNGRKLNECYATEELVRELIAGGDISSLGKRITPTPGSGHSFVNSEDEVTVYYGRDRGNEGFEPATLPTVEAWLNSYAQEYNYLFVGGVWAVQSPAWSSGEFKQLDEALKDPALVD
jgi:hypothetical protein